MSWIEPTKKPPVNTEVLAQKDGKHFVCQWDGEHWMIDDQMIDTPAAWRWIDEPFEKGQPVYFPMFSTTCNVAIFDRIENGKCYIVGSDGKVSESLAVYKTESEARDAVEKMTKIANDFFSNQLKSK